MADKKRKGLMEVLAEYRSEQEAKRKGVSIRKVHLHWCC